jgi:hypothetical protein
LLRPAFDEGAAHRFGLEAACPPLLQSLGEPQAAGTPLPQIATLLYLPEPPALVLHVRPGLRPGDVVTLVQAADASRIATIGPGALRFTSAARGDLFGNSGAALPMVGGEVRIPLEPREVAAVCLSGLEPAGAGSH